MRKEFQIKLPGFIDHQTLIDMRAEPLGKVAHKDTYLSTTWGTWRIRDQDGELILTQKSHDVGSRVRIKEVTEQVIDEEAASELMRRHGVRASIFKSSMIYRWHDTIISVDEVEQLGSFVEIRGADEDSPFNFIMKAGLHEKDVIKVSYLDMMLEKHLSKWLQTVLRFHERVGELTFGITSGILTTVGVLVGMCAATPERIAIVAAIVAIAVADSFSDAFGIYMCKMSDRGNNRKAALRYAAGTFAGKCFFPLTFVVPILYLPIKIGIGIDLAWGGTVLALLSAEQAIVAQKSIGKTVGQNMGLAVLIIAAATTGGMLVARYVC
ncbi:CYTH domain-containing protein [Patescibacteria group bacterium]